MTRILVCVAGISILAALSEYLLPRGSVRELAKNAIGLAEILCIVEILVRVLGIE